MDLQLMLHSKYKDELYHIKKGVEDIKRVNNEIWIVYKDENKENEIYPTEDIIQIHVIY